MDERDKELTAMAAKAAGVELEWIDLKGKITGKYHQFWAIHRGGRWSPLDDDGPAFRLATTLHMMINIEHGQTEVCAHPAVSAADSIVELHNGDPLAATRRAIVRCAAQGVTK